MVFCCRLGMCSIVPRLLNSPCLVGRRWRAKAQFFQGDAGLRHAPTRQVYSTDRTLHFAAARWIPIHVGDFPASGISNSCGGRSNTKHDSFDGIWTRDLVRMRFKLTKWDSFFWSGFELMIAVLLYFEHTTWYSSLSGFASAERRIHNTPCCWGDDKRPHESKTLLAVQYVISLNLQE